MLSAFASAFRTPDLRKKLLFTLAIIVLYRLGASMPTPNTNTTAINDLHQARPATGANANIYSLINLFSGGALLRLSVFALGHHALHHREHHHPAAGRGDPALRAAEEGRPVRPAEADPVQPLPDHRPGHPAVDRLRRAGPLRPAVPGLQRRADPVPQHDIFTLATMVICMTAGTARHHVARRADHRPRRRQRHERADVHLDRGPHPVRGPDDPAERRRLRLHADHACWAWRSSSRSSSSSRPSAASRCSTPNG